MDRAELTLSRDVTASRGYNGTADANGQVTNVTLTGQQNGENISVALAGAVYNAASVADANAITITYTITAAGGAKLANYRVKIADADAVDAAALMTETVGAAITAAPVTVTIADQSAVYDGAKPEVGNQQNIHWRVTQGTIYQLVAGTDDDLGIELDIADTAKDVNTYCQRGIYGHCPLALCHHRLCRRILWRCAGCQRGWADLSADAG